MITWSHSTFDQELIACLENDAEKFLSESELRAYRKLTIQKRKDEWLASRFLAKCLVKEVLSDPQLSLSQIEVHKEASGLPYIVIGERRVGRLSLSHSDQAVIVAFSTDSKASVGVDIESLEARSQQMTDLFFTPYESRWVNCYSAQELVLAQNLVWSAKESYLKAIGKGLQLDTRTLTITAIPTLSSKQGWQELNFTTANQDELRYSLVYQVLGKYVLTLCGDHARKLEHLPLDLAQVRINENELLSCLACSA